VSHGEPGDLRVAALAAAYRSGRLAPEDVAEQVHAAASAHAAATNAWIALTERDELLRAAQELAAGPRDLPLFGVPVAVKDNIDVAGMPTTAGCPPFAAVARADATAVDRLRRAGALIVGKTNLDQFATGLVGTRSPYGACSSVFSARHVSGGSSSGSAVSVADGVVSVALGTDTAGSGRVPAAFNGIVGVKPTRGLVGSAGVVPACRSLDCVSVFSPDVEGGRRALAALAGLDPADPYSRVPLPGGVVAAGASLRIGVPAAAPLTGPPLEAWRRAVAAAADVADAVVEVDLEPFLAAGRLLYAGPWLAERQAVAGETLARGGPGIDPVVRAVVLDGPQWTAADAFAAQASLAALRTEAARAWADADVLLVPTAPFLPTHEEVAADPIRLNARLGVFTTFANLLDLAAVAVPGPLRSDGLPFGLTLLGPAFSDARLLDLAARWPAGQDDAMELVVCGAHLRGLPLNPQLLGLGARFVRATATAPGYRLYALPGPEPRRPGLVREEDGAAIDVEVWRLSAASLGRLAASIPAPLGFGTVELADGGRALGFLCEAHATTTAEDITVFGGWREYLAVAAAV
jgi:allophanate hydrolase